MNFRLCSFNDADKIINFYDRLMDYLQNQPYGPLWRKGIYPTNEDLLEHLNNNIFLVLEDGEKIVGAVALTEGTPPGYENVLWSSNLEEDQFYCVHLLALDQDYQKQGLSRRFLDEIARFSRDKGKKALRLDVIKDNLPAKRTYEKYGFNPLGLEKIFYEDTGWMEFWLYDYEL